jgi:asparagine synthase (glutamine-hydrolysing)
LKAGGDEGTLFLARDRLGIKPLYYYAENSEFRVSSSEFRVEDDGAVSYKLETRNSKLETRFVFASEVRTLLASGVVPRRLSRDALESYLLFGSVSEPMTLVEGVLSLPPGHRMTVKLGVSKAAVTPERYWNIATLASSKASANIQAGANGRAKRTDLKASAAQVRTLLEESVRKHLIADVPVGVFLSSGIDSTALAALASREVSGVHTFTVAFPEKEFSEAAIARRTAERLGTTHQEVMLTGDEMLARLGEAVGALDQPSMDGINTYFVSWSARQAGLKVALSGLGGDEVFGGYSSFSRTAKYQRIASISASVPGGVRSAMASAGGQIMSGDAGRKIAALLNEPRSLPDPFYFGRSLFTPDIVAGLMNETKRNGGEPLWWNWLAESAAEAKRLDSFAAVSCMEAHSYLVNTLLRDTDSMSMAHSLEVRVPFLDHPLVEFVTQLPQKAKVHKGIPKALLVAALEDLLPADVVKQTKRGFTFPWAAWLRGPLRSSIENGFLELSPALQGTLNAENLRGVWRSYLGGKTSWSRPWSLYVLNEWTRKHLA